jgi:hypothetical protein
MLAKKIIASEIAPHKPYLLEFEGDWKLSLLNQ